MGMFSGMVRRANSCRAKIEEYSDVYFRSDFMRNLIHESDYRDMHIKIFGGSYPFLSIGIQNLAQNKSQHAVDYLYLTDVENTKRTVVRTQFFTAHPQMYSYYYDVNYNGDDDYVLGRTKYLPGWEIESQDNKKKYSLPRLIQDAHRFIDQIIERDL